MNELEQARQEAYLSTRPRGLHFFTKLAGQATKLGSNASYFCLPPGPFTGKPWGNDSSVLDTVA